MSEINSEHPEYTAKKQMWRMYEDLYVGGEQLRGNASEYLVRRQREPLDVYGERVGRVFYENYVGSIIDWYAATLFRREPELIAEGDNHAGKRFVGEFTEDCDLRGTSLSEFFRRQLINALVYGSSHILIDFPRRTNPVGSRAEEEASGAARAYLVGYTPEQVINWSRNERGQLEWVVIRTSMLHKESADSGEWTLETRWTHYDTTSFRTYRRLESKESRGSDEPVLLVDEGRHALASQRRVPLVEIEIQEGLWLMNKAGLLQLEHFNKSNALSWALTMGLFATPVVYTDREWNQIVGESYYIQLGPQDRFGWTEPEGHVFQIAADNLGRLQQEIYRVCYLMTQAGGPLASRAAQSGLSKQRDFAITQEVLRAYGDAVKDTIKRVLRLIVDARQDNLTIGVSGLDEFDIGDFAGELTDAERMLKLGIQSTTLTKQVYKKLAFKYLCDANQEIKDRIAREIDEQFESAT